MGQVWNWFIAILLIATLFIAIPLYVGQSKNEKMLQSMFDEYTKKFNKTYTDPVEYQERFSNFKESIQEIDHLNSLTRGNHIHKVQYGLTKMSDLSKLEYSNQHLSDEQVTKLPKTYQRSWKEHTHHQELIEEKTFQNEVYSRKKRSPATLFVDWREKGVVGPVKNQGLCGACWAYSTVGTIESMAAMKTGKFTELSVQEAIDCATLGNKGCMGGDICLLLDWLVLAKKPLDTAKQYPESSKLDSVCKLKKNDTGVMVKTFTCDDMVGSEALILESLATHGPVTVAVNALTWQNYLGGIIQFHCSGALTDLNHAVQLVGYDLSGDVPYYIARNSWGADFGEGGYLRLAVGTNVCGLANEVASVDVA